MTSDNDCVCICLFNNCPRLEVTTDGDRERGGKFVAPLIFFVTLEIWESL